MNKIYKFDNSFVMYDENNRRLAIVSIDGKGPRCGQMNYVNEVEEHIANYKKTDLKYIQRRKKVLQRKIDKLMSTFTIHIEEMAELEKNEKLCNAVPGKNV